MNLRFLTPKPGETGSALLLTMIMSAAALGILAGAMAWSATNARLTDRSNRYTQAVAAAETATEKVVSQISADYVDGAQGEVLANLDTYRHMVPTTSDSSFWSDWQFSDASGNVGQTWVSISPATNYVVVSSTYSGLKGFASTATVVSNARQPDAVQSPIGAVMEQVQLANVPIFQFAMYTSGDMEISCGQPFTVTGRVHSNGQLYTEPDSALTFASSVTAVGSVLFQRAPQDTNRAAPVGTVVYQLSTAPAPNQTALNLPIGMSNSPTAVREITQPPPGGEDPNSPLGRLRYYNMVDMLVVVYNTNVLATSGLVNSFSTLVPTNQWPLFIATNNSFADAREGKTIRPIDINIGMLTAWSATNTSVRLALGGQDVSSLYVLDKRTLPATNLGAVRLYNGQQLPSRGLTVATSSPMYIWGNYNQTNNANLGTTNTSTTVPASIAADAITILSTNWTDANSRALVSSRQGRPTTVNTAILAGAVETAAGNYGGGMENFPRFLETWGLANPFTYNGSMVKMFPSLYATNIWGKTNVYAPPARNWTYDINFDNPLRLPPLTPGLQKVSRRFWTTLAPNQTAVPVSN